MSSATVECRFDNTMARPMRDDSGSASFLLESDGDHNQVLRPVLTQREIAVLTLVCHGFTARIIAERLAISPHTVEHHKRHIFEKLGVQSQAHAVSVALRAGLISM